MQQSLSQSILVNLVQCILQSRVDVQKKQIRRFDQINKQIQKKKQKSYDGRFDIFFKALLIKFKHEIRQLISKQHSQNACIRVTFSLRQRQSPHNIITAEQWTINFQQYFQYNQQEDEYSEQFLMIITVFEEMLLFLNQQPLFSEYQRSQKMKKKYEINYDVKMLTDKMRKNQQTDIIMTLPNKYTKQRVCKYLGVQISCYFLPKSSSCWDSFQKRSLNSNQQNNQEQKTSDTYSKDQHKKRKHSETIVTSINQKSNIYQFYDKQLDFVFLSSDNEELKRHPENQFKEVDLGLQQSEEFQLLMLTRDQELINENKNLLSQLTQMEKQYFVY